MAASSEVRDGSPVGTTIIGERGIVSRPGTSDGKSVQIMNSKSADLHERELNERCQRANQHSKGEKPQVAQHIGTKKSTARDPVLPIISNGSRNEKTYIQEREALKPKLQHENLGGIMRVKFTMAENQEQIRELEKEQKASKQEHIETIKQLKEQAKEQKANTETINKLKEKSKGHEKGQKATNKQVEEQSKRSDVLECKVEKMCTVINVLQSEMADMKINLAKVKHDKKSEIAGMKTEMAEMKIEMRNEMSEMKNEMSEMKKEMKYEMGGMKNEIKTEMSEMKKEMVDIHENQNKMMKMMEDVSGKLPNQDNVRKRPNSKSHNCSRQKSGRDKSKKGK